MFSRLLTTTRSHHPRFLSCAAASIPSIHHSSRIHSSSSTRLLGSKVGSGVPGTITVDDEREKDDVLTIPIDLDRLRQTASQIRQLLGYETYDMSIILVDDEDMREANKDSRGVDAPTDILSFPFHDCHEPGKLEEPRFDISDYYNLGDIVIDVPYVMRVCESDQQQQDEEPLADDEEYDDRGVAPSMESVSDPETRVNMLLVHGMLHLVGYDHEEDDDYEAMVTKEEEFLNKLNMKPSSV